LGEYQIPYFGEATAVAIGPTFSFTTAKLFTKVIMNLAAWPAGTRIANRTPEVVLFAESQYLPSGDANLSPIGEGFIIVKVNGYPEPLLRQFQILGNKVPGPENSFFFKIITDTEITQHLEESKVFAITHRIYISGAKALLAGS
jgi:hypothetical protein